MWDLLQAVLLGSGAGLLGSLLTEGMSIWRYSAETKARQMTYEHEKDLIKLQQAGRKEELESELAIADLAADESVRVASYQHDAQSGQTSVWVNNTLRLVRPILTLMLIGLTTFIAATFDDMSMEKFANQVITLTSMSVSWWFGDRGKKKAST